MSTRHPDGNGRVMDEPGVGGGLGWRREFGSYQLCRKGVWPHSCGPRTKVPINAASHQYLVNSDFC